MVARKKMLEIIEKALKDSFSDGELLVSKANKYINLFKNLPTNHAILFLTKYKEGIKREEEKTSLHIESSFPLSLSQTNKIIAAFKRKQHVMSADAKVNPSLLGGILIKIGDIFYEDTLTSRIDQIGETIQNG